MQVSMITITNPAFLEGHWEEVDATSFDTYYVVDHPYMDMFDPWTWLACVAGKTERIKLGTHVTAAPMHHPTELARAVATVDVVSKGRVRLGMGANYNHKDFLPFGFGARPPISERLERMEEMLQIMKLLWTEDAAEFKGRWFEYKGGATIHPRPVQDPHPPIIIGLNIPGKLLDIAVREASEINTWQLGPDALAELDRAAAERCESAGRPPLRLTADVLLLPNQDETAAKAVVSELQEYVHSSGRAGQATNWNIGGALFGTPEQMVEQAKRFADVGVEEITVTIDSVKQMNWFNIEVLPGITSL